MILGGLLGLLAGCGGSAPAPSASTPAAAPAPPGPAPTDPRADACAWVVTADQATAIYTVGRGLAATGSCTFEDVQVEGSVVRLSFDTADGTKAPSTLRPLACVDPRPEGAVVKDPWILEIPQASRDRCPEGYKALVEAVITGRLPAPSPAR